MAWIIIQPREALRELVAAWHIAVE